MNNTLTLEHIHKGIGQLPASNDPIMKLLEPYMNATQVKMNEVISTQMKEWAPTFAIWTGIAIGLSMLIGTQIPRWHIGGK